MYQEYTILDHDNNKEYIGSYEAHLNLDKNSTIISNYFLERHKMKKDILKSILNKINNDKITILMNVHVNHSYRNQGYGDKLMDHFINQNSGVIILIADLSESSFIEKWYKSYDFDTITYLNNLPIMIKN